MGKTREIRSSNSAGFKDSRSSKSLKLRGDPLKSFQTSKFGLCIAFPKSQRKSNQIGEVSHASNQTMSQNNMETEQGDSYNPSPNHETPTNSYDEVDDGTSMHRTTRLPTKHGVDEGLEPEKLRNSAPSSSGYGSDSDVYKLSPERDSPDKFQISTHSNDGFPRASYSDIVSMSPALDVEMDREVSDIGTGVETNKSVHPMGSCLETSNRKRKFSDTCLGTHNDDVIESTIESDEDPQYSFQDKFLLLPPPTELSVQIEDRVNQILPIRTDHVYVRFPSNLPRTYILEHSVSKFLSKFGVTDEFPYMSRLIMCFQKVDNGYVAFFAAYFQEYDAKCPPPNRNSVYLAMLDSLQLCNPPSFKRQVIFTILISVLEYLQLRGFQHLFVWSCPPRENNEYIFQGRPRGQKNPTSNSLKNWYTLLYKYAMRMGILDNLSNLKDYCKEKPDEELFLQLPLFFEDHWPSAIQEAIQSYKPAPKYVSKNKKRRRLNVAKDLDSHVHNVIMSDLKDYKEEFLYMRFRKPAFSTNTSLDCEIPSLFANSRDELVEFFCKQNLVFRNSETGEVATRQLLLRLQQEAPLIYCDLCTLPVNDGFSCGTCKFDICNNCLNCLSHQHPLERKIVQRESSKPCNSSKAYEDWKNVKKVWWYAYAALIKNTQFEGVALKLLRHIQECTQRESCPVCIKTRDATFFELNKRKNSSLRQNDGSVSPRISEALSTDSAFSTHLFGGSLTKDELNLTKGSPDDLRHTNLEAAKLLEF